jgi:hypothetical protein
VNTKKFGNKDFTGKRQGRVGNPDGIPSTEQLSMMNLGGCSHKSFHKSFFLGRTPGTADEKVKRRGGSPAGAWGKETQLTKGSEEWGGRKRILAIALYTGRVRLC